MSVLKPCPKCGGIGQIEKLYTMFKTYTVPITWVVICSNCNFMTDSKGTKAAAIRSWNRRAEDK